MNKITSVSNNNSIYRDKHKAYKYLLFFYKTFYFVSGLHFGFIQFKHINSKTASFILMTISTAYCAIQILIICQFERPFVQSFWYLYGLVLYFICAIVLAFIKKELTFCSLYHDLQIIDLGLKVNHASYYLEVKLMLSIFVCFITRLCVSTIFCMTERSTCNFDVGSVVFIEMSFANDIALMNCAFMFYALNCRLKKLASRVLSENSNYLPKQYLYKSIVDIAEQYKDTIIPLYITSLMFNIVQVMITIYCTVAEIKGNLMASFAIGSQYSNALQVMFITLMPALCAGMLSTQAENIKIILHDKLLQPQELAQASRIVRFIRYVEARGCRWRVFARLPLDARLLAAVLSFCATYLIVIIQFTYSG